MAPLPSMAVAANLKEILGITTADELTESALSQARVIFTSNFPDDAWLRWGTSLYRVPPIGYPDVRVNTDGDIVLNDDDESPVLLLAQDDGLNVRGLQWHISVSFPAQVIPPSAAGQMRPWWFDALGDGDTVDLKTTIPVVAAPISGVSPMSQIYSSQILDAGSVGIELIQADDQADAWLALGDIPVGNLPDLSLIQYKGSKANQAAMLATTGELGDWITRVDTSSTWIITGSPTTSLGSWTELPFPSIAATIHAATSKTTPVNADELALVDSEASFGLKKLSMSSLRGTVAPGVKGGKTTLLRRRDIRRADVLSPWYGQITPTVQSGFASSFGTAQSYAMSATPSWCTPVNGAQFTSYPLSGTSFMQNWRSPNGGIVGATTYPWPTGTGIEFELDTTTLGTFETYFRVSSPATGFFYNLWIDGQRVWDLPQTGSLTANSSQLLKFTGLPSGVHRYRVVINQGAIHNLFTPQYTIPVKPPARGPRVFFLGDSLMSVGANSGTSGMHTGIELGAWPWRFAEMIGCDDLWEGGIGSTGFIATAGGRTVTDGAMTSGSNILQSATAAFVTGDAGAPPANACQVVGAGPGGSVLSALITSRTDATHVVLDTNASTTVTGAWTRIGGSASNFVIRAITDVVPAAPDIVIVGGWHNDASSGATLIADAYNRAITAIQTALPNTMIIPFGAWDSVGTGGATYTTIDAAVRAVCTARGVPYIETGNNGDVYDGAGTIVATQGKWIDTNTKNLYTCSDNTHETDAGMTYIAHRMCQAIYALLPA